MNDQPADLPPHYRAALRTLIRFAIALAFFGLISGVLFQESGKKLDHAAAPSGLHLEATLRLALLHGHVFVSAVILPLALAFALTAALRIGGGELSPRSLAFLTRGYLPFVTISLGLMLYKGYHVLLHVRAGSTDMDAILADLFGGNGAVRHSVYGVAHVAMAICLGVFLVGLWRSLPKGARD